MKRKYYQKPTMNIVECEQETELLQASASGEVNATMDETWEEEDI